jgi:hypothetical protein
LAELRLSPEGPPWLAMGTARTSEWLVHDEEGKEQIALKRRLLAERRDDVFQALPGTDDACSEILEAIATGNRQLLPRVHPLEEAALLVQEDLCVLVDGVLAAGCVCFPSHWRLADKIGRPITEVHARVPGYDTELASKVDSFLRRLTTGTVVARRNFTIHERPDLFAPDVPPLLGLAPHEQWLRSERQTLRRLPRSDAILFTIRTQQVQLQHVDRPTRQRLAARLRAEPEGLIAYRDLTDRLPALIAWLGS